MLTKKFWIDTCERVVRTMAQSLIAILGTNALGIIGLDWVQILSITASAGLMSLLTAIVASKVGNKGTAEFIKVGP